MAKKVRSRVRMSKPHQLLPHSLKMRAWMRSCACGCVLLSLGCGLIHGCLFLWPGVLFCRCSFSVLRIFTSDLSGVAGRDESLSALTAGTTRAAGMAIGPCKVVQHGYGRAAIQVSWAWLQTWLRYGPVVILHFVLVPLACSVFVPTRMETAASGFTRIPDYTLSERSLLSIAPPKQHVVRSVSVIGLHLIALYIQQGITLWSAMVSLCLRS